MAVYIDWYCIDSFVLMAVKLELQNDLVKKQEKKKQAHTTAKCSSAMKNISQS